MLLPLKWKERLGRRAILVKRGSLLEVWQFTMWMGMPEVLTNEILKRGEIVEGPEKPDFGEEINRLEAEIAELTAERDRISSEIIKGCEIIIMAKDTKERILEAALEMFSQYGFAGTNIRELAGSLGMSKSSIYRHFESKEEIWNVLLDELVAYYEARFGSPELFHRARIRISGRQRECDSSSRTVRHSSPPNRGWSDWCSQRMHHPRSPWRCPGS